jgi:hypothetical protein
MYSWRVSACFFSRLVDHLNQVASLRSLQDDYTGMRAAVSSDPDPALTCLHREGGAGIRALSFNRATETEHDFSVDVIVTPDDVMTCDTPRRPRGLIWANLSPEKIAAIPVLAARDGR